MKKLLRYLANTILFIVLWGVQLFIVIGYSVAEVGVRLSGSIAIGGIVALIISFAIVKRINKSKLWSRLFDEIETLEKEVKPSNLVEEKKVEVKEEKTKKNVEVENTNIFSLKNITIAILAVVLISLLFLQLGKIEYNKDYNTTEQTEFNIDDEILLLEKKFTSAGKEHLLLQRYRSGEPGDPKSEINVICQDRYGNMIDCFTDKILRRASEEPFLVTFKDSYQPVTGIAYRPKSKTYAGGEWAYKNGLLNGLCILNYGDGLKTIKLYENDNILIIKEYKNNILIKTKYFKERKIFKTID